jgi:hypothetical protein
MPYNLYNLGGGLDFLGDDLNSITVLDNDPFASRPSSIFRINGERPTSRNFGFQSGNFRISAVGAFEIPPSKRPREDSHDRQDSQNIGDWH